MGYIAADGLAMGFTVAAQSAATKNETIKLIINGVEFNADRALVQAVDEPLDSVMKKFHSLEVCQNQTEDNVRGQNPVKYKNWETIGEYLKKNDFNVASPPCHPLPLRTHVHY